MKYFLIAGEASGDLHASNLMKAIKQNDTEADFCFLGGDLMTEQGGKIVKHYRDMAFMGFINVLLNLKKVFANISACKKSILEFKPDVVILIDYPSFNLRIAEFIKKEMKTPIFYYISPKIWAWKEFRIKAIKKNIDHMYCILPFEVDFYKKHAYKVTYVGNPTVDSVSDFLKNNPENETLFRKENKLDNRPIVALLGGSRKQEIESCLPKMLKMEQKFPDYQFVIASAPGIETKFYTHFSTCTAVVSGQTYDLLRYAKAAIVNSGTATLETALIGTPEVVVYSVFGGKLASLLKKWFINVPYISLVNLIAKRELVKELVAHLFTEKNLEEELKLLLYNEKYRSIQIEGFKNISNKLGDAGCAQTTASLMIKTLQG